METLFTGQVHFHLAECPSVNTYATEMVKSREIAEGTVISTLNQTNGRGQYGNKWHSEEGKNITACIIYRPKFLQAQNIFALSMAVSLAIHDLLTYFLGNKHDIKIKWPNDILVDGKKICGILIENIFRGSSLDYSLVGIGLNVNQFKFPNELFNATSMKIIRGFDFDIKNVLVSMCSYVEARYLQLKPGDFWAINKQYNSRLFLLNLNHIYRDVNGKEFSGKIIKVGLSGSLDLQCDSGELRSFKNKELIF
ncbi:MAG: biotin--[acetyl-CoA-carboxylase] ligase [Bacteroidota bacterium]